MTELSDPPTSVAAIVLAAGRSRRMGRAKALLRLPGGETFLERLVRTFRAAGAHPVYVVHSVAWQEAAELPQAGEVVAVLNPAPDRGQLSSLQCGLAAIPSSAPGALFTPVDVPLVAPGTVAALIEARHRSRADVVRPERAGRHGHPVLVSRRVIDAIVTASEAETTRTVLGLFADSTLDVAVDDTGAFSDIDTPEDYERMLTDWR